MRQITSRIIKRNFFVALLLAPFVPVVLALGTGGYLFWNHVQQGGLDSLSLLARSHARMVDSYLDDCLGDLALVEGRFAGGDKVEMRSVLENLQRKRGGITDVALVDQNGSVRGYAGPGVFKGTHTVPGRWLEEALERGSSVSGVMAGQMGLPYTVIARRISMGGEPFVLRASLDPEVFTRMVMDVREDGTEVFLVTRKGEIIAGSEGQTLIRERELFGPAFWDRVGGAFLDDRSGAAYASRVLKHAGWIVAVREYSPVFFRTADSTVLFLVLSVLCGGIIVFLSSLYLTGYVEKMLRQREGEREQLREQLYRAGRLAELGEMAAGFAHEINNPLQVMKSEQAYMEMLLQDFRERAGSDAGLLADVEEMAGGVGQIKVQIDRCARITHSILSFGRAGEVEVQNVELGRFIPEVLRMVQKKVQLNNIDLRVAVAASRLVVQVDPGRLQQVLLNLLNNAIHAVGDVTDGRTGDISLTCAPEGSDRVRISIRDNGMGVTPENQKLIFTPFFTTKPAGSGTGLGLSVCHGLVDSMNGVLDFESVPGRGSTFFIVLPRVPSPSA
ncbi:sensor histidine kinase [Desulfomicrobium orale]|uniref:histidine kinase n=1 Tax=Desulfomicrobium orale DSM 12838 TaxID=888061 RepID=A0A0X8JQN8_9BACT|nr:PAS domain-containing sensor histidine kinase [Desulfomicrobium orale]AMD93160.1 hypothetical protein AXF15_08645 [Desulfomicrobium orale DSM 12838]